MRPADGDRSSSSSSELQDATETDADESSASCEEDGTIKRHQFGFQFSDTTSTMPEDATTCFVYATVSETVGWVVLLVLQFCIIMILYGIIDADERTLDRPLARAAAQSLCLSWSIALPYSLYYYLLGEAPSLGYVLKNDTVKLTLLYYVAPLMLRCVGTEPSYWLTIISTTLFYQIYFICTHCRGVERPCLAVFFFCTGMHYCIAISCHVYVALWLQHGEISVYFGAVTTGALFSCSVAFTRFMTIWLVKEVGKTVTCKGYKSKISCLGFSFVHHGRRRASLYLSTTIILVSWSWDSFSFVALFAGCITYPDSQGTAMLHNILSTAILNVLSRWGWGRYIGVKLQMSMNKPVTFAPGVMSLVSDSSEYADGYARFGGPCIWMGARLFLSWFHAGRFQGVWYFNEKVLALMALSMLSKLIEDILCYGFGQKCGLKYLDELDAVNLYYERLARKDPHDVRLKQRLHVMPSIFVLGCMLTMIVWFSFVAVVPVVGMNFLLGNSADINGAHLSWTFYLASFFQYHNRLK